MEGGAAVSAENTASESSSYTYWVREASLDAAPLPAPKKIDPADLCNQPSQTHLGSAWNRVCILVARGKKLFFWLAQFFFRSCSFACYFWSSYDLLVVTSISSCSVTGHIFVNYPNNDIYF